MTAMSHIVSRWTRLLGMSASLAAVSCSFVYDADDLRGGRPGPTGVDAAPAVDARPQPADADPADLTLAKVQPSELREGQGSAGRGGPVLVTGSNITDEATVEIAVDGAELDAERIGVEGPWHSDFHDALAVEVAVPVIEDLGDGEVVDLTLTVAQPGAEPQSLGLELHGLDEFSPGEEQAELTAEDLEPLYSRITFDRDVRLTGPKPVRLRATAEIVVDAELNASGFPGDEDGGGAPGAGGCAGGGPDGDGRCGDGGGRAGSTSDLSAPGGGGGGSFGVKGDGGDGGDSTGGAAGEPSGEPHLVPLVAQPGQSGNRGNGGGGGAGGLGAARGGGGGGGVIELTSEGTLEITGGGLIRADGGGGGSGGTDVSGGCGGGGSGGAVLVRARAGMSWEQAPVRALGGPGGDSGCSNDGGDGGVGRTRIDRPEPGPISDVESPTPWRGPMWAEGVPAVVTESPRAFALVGGGATTYAVRVPGGQARPVTLEADGTGSVMVELDEGLNRICALVEAGIDFSLPEAVNCIDVAYLAPLSSP